MKTINILKVLALLACSLIYSACEEELGGQDGPDSPETVIPNFPELIENYAVEPGSTQEIVFTPNLDWKLYVPSEIRQWFWIQDESFKVTELTGKASTEPVTVKIGVTETAEFDKNFSCDVTLEMGDSAKVVAKYMLPAKEKTMQVYTAKTLSENAFELAEDGTSYVYYSEEATKFELIWSAADADFRLPVRVSSNCEWTVEVPEWAEVNVPESTTGVVDFIIKGEAVEGADGMVIFKNGDSVLAELDVTVPACGGIEVYAAKFDNGEFEFGEDGEYAWSESTVDEISLAWLGSDFRVPVKVSAKCNWTVVMPDWLSVELPEKTSGDVTLTFLGVPSEYPLEDTSSKIVFMYDNEVINEVKVNIPGCKDIMEYTLDMSLTELEYNFLGELKTSTGYVEQTATGNLMGTKYVRILSVETTGNTVGKLNPSWLNVEVASWNTATGSDVLQTRTMTFSVSKNEGDLRSAVVFILPSSVSVSYADLFNQDTSVKDEYLKWAINVTQKSDADREYIMMENSSDDSEYAFTFEKAGQDKYEELISVFGETEYVYVLTYESPYSRDNADMLMLSDYYTYKIYSKDDTATDMSENKDFWLKFTSGVMDNKSGKVDMYSDMDLPVKQSVGYVVFYSSDNKVLAIVECVSPYEDEKLVVDETSLIFMPNPSTSEINVTSNVPWTVTSNAEWCTVSPESGSRNGVVTISVDENALNEDRNTEVTIKSENITHVVKVTQKFGEALEVNVDEVVFDCLKESKTIKVSSNVSWTIESSEEWCTVSPNSGNSNPEIEVTVSVARNVETTDRTAVLTIKSAELTREVTIVQRYDDGSRTNGDEIVHFADWTKAKEADAILERLTSGEIYDTYKDGDTPIYHLTYSKVGVPLRVTLPSTVVTHNVNPWSYLTYIRVNGTIYTEYRGPSGRMGEVVLDEDGSVEISMELPEGLETLRGNINFLPSSGDGIAVILVCTLDPNAN